MLAVVSDHGFARDWFLAGSCRTSGLDPDAWFPVARSEKTIPTAKAICQECPVRQQCLVESLRFSDVQGIWAGMDERERRRHVREMR